MYCIGIYPVVIALLLLTGYLIVEIEKLLHEYDTLVTKRLERDDGRGEYCRDGRNDL